MTDLANELRTAARLANDVGATGAAEIIHSFLNPRTDADARAFRRTVLRSIWRRVYFSLSRTAAAKTIAASWLIYNTTTRCEHDDLRTYLDLLNRGGASPLAWRQIADDLDSSFDRR